MAKVLRNIKSALKLGPDSHTEYILGGRVSKYRSYKKIHFIDLFDGSTDQVLQVVVSKDLIRKPDIGGYISGSGNLVKSSGALQNVEFKVNQISHIGSCNSEEYPLVESAQLTDDQLRRFVHLRPRAPHLTSLLRMRSELELGISMIMKQMDFFKVHTPILTANDSEASSDLFAIQRTKTIIQQKQHDTSRDRSNQIAERHIRSDYFQGKQVFMISSAQLHLEALAASLSRVYCLSPAFRAENSLTRRHLCEFNMLEAEEANLTSLDKLMNRVETIVKFGAQFISEVSEYKSDCDYLLTKHSHHDTLANLSGAPFVRLSYREAVDALNSNGLSSLDYGHDLGTKNERKLLEIFNNVPIFITNFPKQLKPFYMKCDASNTEALCFDLIAPIGGEICGGSLREDDLDKLKANLAYFSQNEPRDFEWYTDLRRFGTFPHGGFGIGYERLIQCLLGFENIKDTIAFPRWAGNCPM